MLATLKYLRQLNVKLHLQKNVNIQYQFLKKQQNVIKSKLDFPHLQIYSIDKEIQTQTTLLSSLNGHTFNWVIVT